MTFLILSYLFFAGTPKVHDRLASQVLRLDLGTLYGFCHCFPPLLVKDRHYDRDTGVLLLRSLLLTGDHHSGQRAS